MHAADAAAAPTAWACYSTSDAHRAPAVRPPLTLAAFNQALRSALRHCRAVRHLDLN